LTRVGLKYSEVRPGECIPVDGVVTEGESHTDEPERGAGIQPRPFSFYFSPVGGTAL